MTYDVLVYGPLFCDLIFTEMPEMPELGREIFANNFTMTIGGSAIVAAGLQKLGAKVGLIADIGNDPLSRVVGQLLDDFSIDRTFVREHPRALTQLTVALSFPEDRAFITRFERPDTIVDLAMILREHPTKHVHIGSFLGAFDMPDACQIVHDAGATISLDPGWDENALRDSRLHNMMVDLDFFLPSRSELCFMMNEQDADKALERTANKMSRGTVIMKNGAEGASAKSKTLHINAPALSVTPIDTTGAGDAFDAGFLYAMTHDYTLQDSMRFGAICGALTTTAIGGATGTPTLEEVKKWL